MKKLMIILLLGSSLLSFGQKETKQKKVYEDFSTEQQAMLQTKKMALELDLNDNQQKQLLDLNKKWAEVKVKKRAEMKSLNKEDMSSTDRFNHMNTMLDEKLARQNELKKILNEDQYNTWKKSSNKMKKGSRGRTEHQHRKQGRSQK
jgi:hypothetical protein